MGSNFIRKKFKKFEQIKNLTNDIRNIFRDKNYPILIDQEGGRVNRLNKLIETSVLTAEYFGNLFKNKKKKNLIIITKFI